MIRLFAALPIPDEIAPDLGLRQRGLAGARWTPRENLHVTLRFFGEVAENVASDLDAALADIRALAFGLQVAGVGAFGHAGALRAVFAAVAPTDDLVRLAGKCETAARRAGLRAEARAFRPHVTLAYLKRTPEVRAAAWLAEHNLLAASWRADAFALYSSWRTADGSRYELERLYPLEPSA